MPVHNEGEHVVPLAERILSSISDSDEVIAVFDSANDTSAPHLRALHERDKRLLPTLNTEGPGAARAIRFGIAVSRGSAIVVTMADGSDDVSQIGQLADLVQGGAAVAVASRYSRGGKQLGAPLIKSLISRSAGASLHYLAGVSTFDPTNAFKGYSRSFIDEVGIESEAGFEMGLELVVKAHRRGLLISEIPTTWQERTQGRSRFRLFKWLPRYLRWYLFAFGKQIRRSDLLSRTEEP